ncbi:MAG TPA: tetratricopeptide repeat protein, partial [Chroococcales cyanobacterium]
DEANRAISDREQRIESENKPVHEPLPPRPVKDNWDKITAVAPIISGALIFAMGGLFTYTFNQQQLKLQEIQTIEKFIPHLMGTEQSKKAAILAISSLTNAELAGKFASIFASSGTVSALETMARSGTSHEKNIAQKAIPDALESLSNRNAKLSEAEANYRSALNVAGQATESMSNNSSNNASNNSEYLFNLARLGQTYTLEGQYDLARPLLQKSLDLRIKTFGPDSAQVAEAYRSLAELNRLSGDTKQAEQNLNLARAVESRFAEAAGQAGRETPSAAGKDASLAPAAPGSITHPKTDNETKPLDTNKQSRLESKGGASRALEAEAPADERRGNGAERESSSTGPSM